MLQHTGPFWSRIPKQRKMTTLDHPPILSWLVPADFYLFPRLKSTQKGGTFVTQMTSLRMRRRSWKCFHKMASRNISNTLDPLAAMYNCISGLFLRKFNLSYCALLYFSKLKRFPETFEATTYLPRTFTRQTLTRILCQVVIQFCTCHKFSPKSVTIRDSKQQFYQVVQLS